jgi:cytochrome b561
MELTNSQPRYGAAAILFHWLMAGLIVALVVVGLYMVRLPDIGFDARKVTLILVHKQVGVAAFLLVCVRWIWRQINVLPRLVDTLPEWQKVIAITVHLCFYALMVALPITGWIMSSYAGIPVWFLGLTLPDLELPNERLFEKFEQLHDWLGYAMLVFMCLHAEAALRHHFVFRDTTLQKMLPTRATGLRTASRTN